MTLLTDTAIILDTETTDRDEGEVIELAYGVTADVFNFAAPWHCEVTRFRPAKQTTFGALAVHHILPSEVASARPSAQAAATLPHARYWIGHNIDFDWRALGAPPEVFRICTLALARKWMPDADSHSLGALIYQLYGATAETREIVKGAHGALADVNMTRMLLSKLLVMTGIETLSGLFSESEDARVPRKWAFGKFEGSSISSADRGYARWFVNTCKDRSDYQYYVVALKRGGLL